MPRARVAIIALVLVVAACGDGKPGATSPASGDGNRLVVPVGPTSSDFWVAGDLPDAYRLAYLQDSTTVGQAFHRSGYKHDGPGDAYDAELQVDSMTSDSKAGFDVASGSSTTVRGHAATLATMTDEGSAYGVALTWEERPGLRLIVRAAQPLTEADARTVAEGVQPVSDDTWQKLSKATDPVAVSDGRLAPDMRRVAATSGVEEGERWQLTALLPADFPLIDGDRRAACYELAFRGATTNGTSCVGHASWERLGGRIFLIGEVPPEFAQVHVTPDAGAAFDIDTAAAPGWSATRFYATPLPEGTCVVAIDAGGKSFGSTGPLEEPSTHDDWLRCSTSAPPGPLGPGPPPPSSTAQTNN